VTLVMIIWFHSHRRSLATLHFSFQSMTQKRKADNISGVRVEPFSQPVSVQRWTRLDSVFRVAKTPTTHPSTTAGQTRTTSRITTICRNAKGRRGHQTDDKTHLIDKPATSVLRSGSVRFLTSKWGNRNRNRNRSRTDPYIDGPQPDRLGPVHISPWTEKDQFRLVSCYQICCTHITHVNLSNNCSHILTVI
jgi:hypothetical protein